NGHDAEAASPGGNHILIILWVFAIHMDALSCQSGSRLSTLPEILEGLFLHQSKQGIVGKRMADGVGTLLCGRIGRLRFAGAQSCNEKEQVRIERFKHSSC